MPSYSRQLRSRGHEEHLGAGVLLQSILGDSVRSLTQVENQREHYFVKFSNISEKTQRGWLLRERRVPEASQSEFDSSCPYGARPETLGKARGSEIDIVGNCLSTVFLFASNQQYLVAKFIRLYTASPRKKKGN